MQTINFLTLRGNYVHHRSSSLQPSVMSCPLFRRHSYVPLRLYSTVRASAITPNSGSQGEPMDDNNEYMKKALKWVIMSPLEKRYPEELKELLPFFSKYNLFRYRTIIQVERLLKLSGTSEAEVYDFLEKIIYQFRHESNIHMYEYWNNTTYVKEQDVKSVVNFLKEKSKYQSARMSQVLKNNPFTCTPEVINLAYGMMLKDAINIVMFPVMIKICNTLSPIVQEKKKAMVERDIHWKEGYSLQKKISNKISDLRQLAELARKIAEESNPNIVKDNVCLLYGIIIEFNTILTDIVNLKLMVKEGDLIDFGRIIDLLSPDPRFKALERNILSKTNPFVVDLVGLLGYSLVGYKGMLEELEKL